MTLQEIEKMDVEYLIPAQVAAVLGCFQYSITQQAKENPVALGFPVIITGTRVRIPRLAFLRFMRGELPVTSGGCSNCVGEGMRKQIRDGHQYCKSCGRRFYYCQESDEVI